jgi:hypothetical protein
VNQNDQIQRIRTKLKAARKADRKLKVFGASFHKYQVGRPASEAEVRQFEEKHSLFLPKCYRSFLTEVGNGGSSYANSAAGPFYGIYPLGVSVDEILENAAVFLNKPAIVEPDMTDEQWTQLTKRISENDIPDEDYEQELGKVYAGLLPIGSQGCTYLHALVLNGSHTGRVVNMDVEHRKPNFAFESNFLDWYERWLDEVISGDLAQDGPTWFGYTMGGDDQHLMRVYANAPDCKTRFNALKGLTKLATATQETCVKLLDLCSDADTEIRQQALRMLTKFGYPMARAPLHAHITGTDDDCRVACQSIFGYAKTQSKEWAGLLKSRLPTVNTPETFRFISYVLTESGVDFSEDFKPFCRHENEEIRVTAFYSLGKLKNKSDFVCLFIVGLDDTCPRVVHTTLQALAGVRDPRLVNAYRNVANRFKTDECYILSNLKHRLKEMGMD